jgi:hypothetical protein
MPLGRTRTHCLPQSVEGTAPEVSRFTWVRPRTVECLCASRHRMESRSNGDSGRPTSVKKLDENEAGDRVEAPTFGRR